MLATLQLRSWVRRPFRAGLARRRRPAWSSLHADMGKKKRMGEEERVVVTRHLGVTTLYVLSSHLHRVSEGGVAQRSVVPDRHQDRLLGVCGGECSAVFTSETTWRLLYSNAACGLRVPRTYWAEVDRCSDQADWVEVVQHYRGDERYASTTQNGSST
jgi:hypothetical protein